MLDSVINWRKRMQTSTSTIDTPSVGAGYLERLREAELMMVQNRIGSRARVLEIGGGSGYQAARLAESGHDVVSIDISNRKPRPVQFFPVRDYDGVHIPAADATFDVIFSSNVMEHVEKLPELLAEMKRVIAPGGHIIHVVPSASWRFWTSLALYAHAIRKVLGVKTNTPGETSSLTVAEAVKKKGLGRLLRDLIWQPHGVYPNSLAELYYFSRARWKRTFRRNGFEIVEVAANRLFYSGCWLFPSVPIGVRRRLSGVLGSSCHIFVLKSR